MSADNTIYNQGNYSAVSSEERKTPPKEAILEALKYPNGWVYEIDELYKGKKDVPPQAIKGAWKVNENGVIIGNFISNPDYINQKKV